MIELSWNDLKKTQLDRFDRVINILAMRHDGNRGELIDVLDEEYTLMIDDNGCLFLEHDRSGLYNLLC